MIQKFEPKVHIDLDPLWIYFSLDPTLKGISDDIYSDCVPQFLSILDKYKVKSVLFCIASDLNDEKIKLIREAIKKGHSIGNHSWSHSDDYLSFTREQKLDDLKKANAFFNRYGIFPGYFRAPGYAGDIGINHTLSQIGYKYDCSRMPTIYTTTLDLYFKLKARPRKKFRSILRLSDWSYIFHKCSKCVGQLMIGDMKHFGFPKYSTTIWRSYSKNQKLRGVLTVPFLFHAIDFLDYYDPHSTIPALRVPFAVRMNYIEKEIKRISTADLETN
jgi:hypothetical protein